jgi:hypothetical protein
VGDAETLALVGVESQMEIGRGSLWIYLADFPAELKNSEVKYHPGQADPV